MPTRLLFAGNTAGAAVNRVNPKTIQGMNSICSGAVKVLAGCCEYSTAKLTMKLAARYCYARTGVRTGVYKKIYI